MAVKRYAINDGHLGPFQRLGNTTTTANERQPMTSYSRSVVIDVKCEYVKLT